MGEITMINNDTHSIIDIFPHGDRLVVQKKK